MSSPSFGAAESVVSPCPVVVSSPSSGASPASRSSLGASLASPSHVVASCPSPDADASVVALFLVVASYPVVVSSALGNPSSPSPGTDVSLDVASFVFPASVVVSSVVDVSADLC